MHRLAASRALALAVSSGLVALAAACGGAGAAGSPAPDRGVDVAAFGTLEGPDSLVRNDSGPGAARQIHNGVFPHFPIDMMRAREGGTVTMAYVVDTTGRVARGTAAVMQATDQRLADSVCAVLPRFAYRPASLDGRKRRSLVTQAFVFTTEGQDFVPADTHSLDSAIKATPLPEVVRLLATRPGCRR